MEDHAPTGPCIGCRAALRSDLGASRSRRCGRHHRGAPGATPTSALASSTPPGPTATAATPTPGGQTATATAIVEAPSPPAAVPVAVGGNHVCALPGDGTVICWGNLDVTQNEFGELGDGTATDPHAPAGDVWVQHVASLMRPVLRVATALISLLTAQ